MVDYIGTKFWLDFQIDILIGFTFKFIDIGKIYDKAYSSGDIRINYFPLAKPLRVRFGLFTS
jgi:hypothetical protein